MFLELLVALIWMYIYRFHDGSRVRIEDTVLGLGNEVRMCGVRVRTLVRLGWTFLLTLTLE